MDSEVSRAVVYSSTAPLTCAVYCRHVTFRRGTCYCRWLMHFLSNWLESRNQLCMNEACQERSLELLTLLYSLQKKILWLDSEVTSNKYKFKLLYEITLVVQMGYASKFNLKLVVLRWSISITYWSISNYLSNRSKWIWTCHPLFKWIILRFEYLICLT